MSRYVVIHSNNEGPQRVFAAETKEVAVEKAFKYAAFLGFFDSSDMKDKEYMDEQFDKIKRDFAIRSVETYEDTMFIKKVWEFPEDVDKMIPVWGLSGRHVNPRPIED